MKLLKQFGARFDVRNTNSGQTALIIAASYGTMSTIKYLLNEFDNPPVFDLNDQNNRGCTTLMYLRNNTKALQSVLSNYLNNVNYESKIDLEIVNTYGKTALMMAKKKNYAKIIEYLLENGAKGANTSETIITNHSKLGYGMNGKSCQNAKYVD